MFSMKNLICHFCRKWIGPISIHHHELVCEVIQSKMMIKQIINNHQQNGKSLIVGSHDFVELSANIEHVYDYLIVESYGTLCIKQEDINTRASALILTINNDLILEEGANIDVSGCGYFSSTSQHSSIDHCNFGRGGFGVLCGGGGGYGTKGEDAYDKQGGIDAIHYGLGGDKFGNETMDILYYGSSGGNGGDFEGGRGGGILVLDVKKSIIIEKRASIEANGRVACIDYIGQVFGGAGSGGSIKVFCNEIFMNAKCDGISAKGGYATQILSSKYAGNGGDGRICLYIEDEYNRQSLLNQWEKPIQPKPYITCCSNVSESIDLMIIGYLRCINADNIIPTDLVPLIKSFFEAGRRDICDQI